MRLSRRKYQLEGRAGVQRLKMEEQVACLSSRKKAGVSE